MRVGRRRDRVSAIVLVAVAAGLALCLGGVVAVAAAQSRPVTRNSRVENVVQGVRRSYESRPAEWRKRAAPCLHYLDEAETDHNKGQAYFVEASRAHSSSEQSRLVRLGNDAIAERDRLINEFWACTRRMTAGDVFASQDPARKEPPPPNDPGEPPTGPPLDREPPSRSRPPDEPGPLPPGFPFPPAEARPPTRPSTKPRPAPAPVIVALGDSITAGYGLDPKEAYPSVLQERLDAEGFRYRVTNAGVTDDTAAGASRRVSSALVPQTKILIVAIGLNDLKAVRPIPAVKADIAAIIEQAQRRRISVLLCGFEAPVSFNDMDDAQLKVYAAQFKAMYPALESQYHVSLLPNMLSIVWNTRGRTLKDGIHPNADGARMIARQVLRALRPMLGAGSSQGSGTARPTVH